MGTLRNPRPSSPTIHYTLPRFILKDPGLQPLKKPPETRGHPGCNDKSKNYPRTHKRRIKPPQALSFRYPWDSVSRSHQTLCHPLHPQCTNYLLWLKKTLSSLSIISFPPSIIEYTIFFVMSKSVYRTKIPFMISRSPQETHFPRKNFPQDHARNEEWIPPSKWHTVEWRNKGEGQKGNRPLKKSSNNKQTNNKDQ